MANCTMATFDDKRSGTAAGRAIKRMYKANTNVFLCGVCDCYHVVVDATRYPVSGSWQEILSLLAQGMTRCEIAKALHMPVRTVDHAVFEMRKRFYALNRAHLVAIAIALGIVNPNAFVPAIEEDRHASA